MYTGTYKLFANSLEYASLAVIKSKLKWWQFGAKREIQQKMDWLLPMVSGELKMFKD